MKRRRFGIAVVLVLVAYFLLFLEAPSPQSFALDINEIRKLAASLPGEHPREIHVEHIADFPAPEAIMMTGGGWSPIRTMWAVSYELLYKDDSVIIDTAMDADVARKMHTVSKTYQDAFDRMTKALPKARAILLTHEHPDHIGGLAAYQSLKDLNLVLTAEQITSRKAMLPAEFAVGALQKGLQYDRLHAIAPGIVLIKSPGHSPGSQMIYVNLEGGEEFLFAGDVGWAKRNIDQAKGRPLLLYFALHEDRAAVLGQLVALQSLQTSEPKLHIVPGHDAECIQGLIAQGRMKAGF